MRRKFEAKIKEVKSMPFVKWVGGKRNLLDYILPNFPNEYNHYYESFIGGGAVFFSIPNKPENTTISDNNFELIIAYKVIQKEPQPLIKLLKTHQKNHSKDYYNKIRSQEPSDQVEMAARLIYLNKTCYNGLYRVNKQGKFNVPMGSYKNPNIMQEDNILACHEALKNTKLLYKDFDEIEPKKNDFIYCDPPYHPTSENSFTSYTKQNFTETDHVRLRDYLMKLVKNGVYIMLSNSNTKFIRDLYNSDKFHKEIVYAPRLVSCKPDSREHVEELLITNYPINIS
ncbi:MAG: Dam family site-specific DNA-(adenine-N6)-methyltransferase [Methanosarcinales archaeon]|nr:MAG: Dam family site-specific DNA-(adenine-N6)-methyltransferase [Methanosarcinales archaeon]